MYDRREAILAQVEVILGSLPAGVAPFVSIYRNRGELKEAMRPAVVLLDGTETTVQTYNTTRTQGSRMAPHLIELRPQIFAVMKKRELELAHEYGPELSSYRMAILRALFSDPTLNGLIGTNGRIEYRGALTDMQTGSTFQGELQINLAITYLLQPGDLLA
jgi:hypothetical protein